MQTDLCYQNNTYLVKMIFIKVIKPNDDDICQNALDRIDRITTFGPLYLSIYYDKVL